MNKLDNLKYTLIIDSLDKLDYNKERETRKDTLHADIVGTLQRMSIWLTKVTLEDLNTRYAKTMVQHIGIEFLEIGNDYIKAKMPVDHRTKQPVGILHGGASVAMAETLGSMAANLCVDRNKKHCVGLEINANHIRQVRSGFVYGVARPIHIGATTQLWEIRINNEQDKLVCISRLTVAVLKKI